MSNEIIAVGYQFYINQEKFKSIIMQLNISNKLELDIDYIIENFENVIRSGVYYSYVCKGGLSDVKKSNSEMNQWFIQHNAKGILNVNLKKIYISKSPLLIISQCSIPPNNFFIFLYNPNNISTTQFKRNIVNGTFCGNSYDIELKITASAYKYTK